MSRFEAYLASAESVRVVRWPFRVLAAMLVAAASFAQISATYLAIAHHETKSALCALALLPIAALIVRTAGLSSLVGRVPVRPLWPFTSGAIALAWIVLLLLAIKYA